MFVLKYKWLKKTVFTHERVDSRHAVATKQQLVAGSAAECHRAAVYQYDNDLRRAACGGFQHGTEECKLVAFRVKLTVAITRLPVGAIPTAGAGHGACEKRHFCAIYI